MAMCVMAVVAVAPCQCFSPGGNQITSPGRISSIGPPQRWTRPQPAVTIRVWPSGCVCQAVRAPGSNVTLAPRTRAGSGASNSGSIRTLPVNQSADPVVELCERTLLISIFGLLTFSISATQRPLIQRRIAGRIHEVAVDVVHQWAVSLRFGLHLLPFRIVVERGPILLRLLTAWML